MKKNYRCLALALGVFNIAEYGVGLQYKKYTIIFVECESHGSFSRPVTTIMFLNNRIRTFAVSNFNDCFKTSLI